MLRLVLLMKLRRLSGAAQDAAESWGGSVFNATIGVIERRPPQYQTCEYSKESGCAGSIIVGASFGVAESVNSFQDFESMMSQVKAISGATGQAFDDLTAKHRRWERPPSLRPQRAQRRLITWLWQDGSHSK